MFSNDSDKKKKKKKIWFVGWKETKGLLIKFSARR